MVDPAVSITFTRTEEIFEGRMGLKGAFTIYGYIISHNECFQTFRGKRIYSLPSSDTLLTFFGFALYMMSSLLHGTASRTPLIIQPCFSVSKKKYVVALPVPCRSPSAADGLNSWNTVPLGSFYLRQRSLILAFRREGYRMPYDGFAHWLRPS